MSATFTLISHALCPYVQRIAIALAEKPIAHARRAVDLSRKPEWVPAISPRCRTPVLVVNGTTLFESNAILESFEATQALPLHLGDPLERARHRAWIGFGPGILAEITGFCAAPDAVALEVRAASRHARFRRIEADLGPGPRFAGDCFSWVDPGHDARLRAFLGGRGSALSHLMLTANEGRASHV